MLCYQYVTSFLSANYSSWIVPLFLEMLPTEWASIIAGMKTVFENQCDFFSVFFFHFSIHTTSTLARKLFNLFIKK